MDTEGGLGVGDSVEKFVSDLQELRRKRGLDGYKTLSRKMKLSHGSVHAALNKNDRLPSEYVLTRMIEFWEPGDVQAWIARRAALDLGSVPVTQSPVTLLESPVGSTTLAGSSRRWRPLVVAVLVGVSVLAILGSAPLDTGGIDVWDFCSATYGDEVGSPPAEGVTDNGVWMCVLADGRRVPADMSRACQEQHPPLTSLGRTFVTHQSRGLTTWRCYTAQVSLPFGN